MILMFIERMRDTDLVRSFFYVRPSPGHFQLYRMITLYRKKLASKKRAENFESAAVFSDL